MNSSPHRDPRAQDPGLAAIERLCTSARAILSAERIVLWRYAAWSRMLAPVIEVCDPAARPASALSSWWANKNIEDIPAFERCLNELRGVVTDPVELRREVWDFADGLVTTSMWCEPVLLHGQPLGVLSVEPAPPRAEAEQIQHLAACIAPLLTWQAAEQGRAQAELLLGLIEAAGAHEGSLGQLLEMVCARLAGEIGVTRASVFLFSGEGLVPRMSSFADCRRDQGAWQRFRSAGEPPLFIQSAFTSQRPVTVTHRGDPKLGRWWSEAFGIQSALAVPLGHTSPGVGVLALDCDEVRAFGGAEVRLLAAAGALLGEIVRRAQQAAEREARLAAGEAMRELLKHGLGSPDVPHMAGRLAAVARELMACEVAVVCLPAESGGVVEVGRSGPVAGPTPAEISAGRPDAFAVAVAVADREREDTEAGRLLGALGLRSGIVVPLVGYGHSAGVLVCGDRAPRPWSARRVELAPQIALEGGLVLEATRLREIDGRRRIELAHQAHHDMLTGLGNRHLFYERLQGVLAVARREGRRVAVLLIDLDRFKEINDGLGHEQGDRLLVTVAQRIQAAVREGDIVARLGGDEFAVALTSRNSVKGALAAARRIVRALTEEIELAGIGVRIGASVGLALAPEHGDSAEELLRHADLAMYEAKREHSSVEVYDAKVEERGPPTLLVARLRQAIAERQLVLHYQPKVDLSTGQVCGAEALVRWPLADGSTMPPSDFIPLAEATGLICQITPLVLADAVQECARWHRQGFRIGVSVNVTAADLGNPAFAQLVVGALRQARLPGQWLTIELTEGSLIRNQRQVVAVLGELRRHGVAVSLDDFGTGYSSLGLLDRLPATELKIDRGFLKERESTDGGAVVQSIATLGHELGLVVVAEGIETEAALELATRMGCDQAQGYYFSRPLPVPVFRDWLRETEARAAAA